MFQKSICWQKYVGTFNFPPYFKGFLGWLAIGSTCFLACRAKNWEIFWARSEITLTLKATDMRYRRLRGTSKQSWVYFQMRNNFRILLAWSIILQGPPYILARYTMAILSKFTTNFQNLFIPKQGCGSSHAWSRNVYFQWSFESASLICYFSKFSFNSSRYEKVTYRNKISYE